MFIFTVIFIFSFVDIYTVSQALEASCMDAQFDCGQHVIMGQRCIPMGWRCDGTNDCPQGQDEDNCQGKRCELNEFKCKDPISTRPCIPRTWKCDGDRDCQDGSDEMDCTVTTTMSSLTRNITPIPMTTINPVTTKMSSITSKVTPMSSTTVNSGKRCELNEFKCKNPISTRPCIPWTWKCDGDRDCQDGSDEMDCTVTTTMSSLTRNITPMPMTTINPVTTKMSSITSKVTPKSSTTVNSAATRVCRDALGETCQFLVSRCSASEISSNCMKTCGVCGESTTVSGMTSTANVMTSTVECADHDIYCNDLARSTNICSSKETASNFCPKTCGLCISVPKNAIVQQSTMATSGAVTIDISTIQTIPAQSRSETPPPTTGSCVDEFNIEICEYLKPQCSFRDVIVKCRKMCGYCDKDVPEATTVKPFTYSPGTIGHVTHTVATTMQPTYGTGTGSGGVTNAPSVPCSGTCCDEIDTSYCMFVIDQCSTFNIADKCKNTCGLCSTLNSTNAATMAATTNTSPTSKDMTTVIETTTSSVEMSSSSPSSVALPDASTSPPVVVTTGSQSTAMAIAGCNDIIGTDTCSLITTQCRTVSEVQNNCQKTCGLCTPSKRSMDLLSYVQPITEDNYTRTQNKRQATCTDDIGADVCVLLVNHCSVSSVLSKCKSTCKVCVPQTTSDSITKTTKPTVPSPFSTTSFVTSVSSIAPQDKSMTSASTDCKDAVATEYCAFVKEQCFSNSVAIQCRKTCNACNLEAPRTTAPPQGVSSVATACEDLDANCVHLDQQTNICSNSDTAHRLCAATCGFCVTGSQSGVTTGTTAAPLPITCNTFSDADVVISDPVHRICYYQFERGVQYPDAKQKCENQGTHVVHIETEEEEIFVNERLQAEGHADQFWLGLENHGGQWYWVSPNSRTPVTETHWEGSDNGKVAYNTPPDHWKAGTEGASYKIICEEQL